MRILLLPLLAATPALGMAQQVVAGGGGHHADATTAISYTIGEPVIATVSAGASTLTQGFHQPWADIGTLVDNVQDDGPAINVYPNPVRHTLHIAIDDAARAQHYFLHDAAGRLVTDGRIGATITELDMEPYASGSYVLRVLGSDNATMKSFKISVTH
ncbi:MAG: T9SS type A sorting domain-containing protein [Flavobacteriales bacterium]|nr:T9SS type A sorting domain-containing protein [Flavobacteriales bacterium]